MGKKMKLMVLNGPNLNLLGEREPGIYGASSLADLEQLCINWGAERNIDVICRQSNHEGDLVDMIQDARTEVSGIVLNAAAYTHTSVAIRDAVAAISTPVVEIHISNTAKRESFRHTSYLTPVAAGLIMGFGTEGYLLALEALLRKAASTKTAP